MDAGDASVKAQWEGRQDERPLTDFGHTQAQAQCDALADETTEGLPPISALYSSPALRARQTIEPLAERLGLDIHIMAEFGDEQTWHVPEGWPDSGFGAVNVAAFASGRAMAGVSKLQTLYPDGHVVVCSHGHVIPALIAHMAGLYDITGVPGDFRRGQWYRLRLPQALAPAIELLDAPDFPAQTS